MTASQMEAPAIPEAGASPAAGEAAPPVAPADGTTTGEGRRKRKVALLLLLLGLFAALLGLAIWYLLFREAVPLPPIPGTEVPHYANSFNNVDHPTGVAVTAAGDRIYVTQTRESKNALVLDANGNKLGELLPPLSTGQDHAPVYIALDAQTGEVYVSDRPTGDIYIYDASGAYLRQFTPVEDRPAWQPIGMAFDAAGNLYVVDLGAAPAQVVEFDRAGNVLKTFGATDNLNFPNCVAVDANGNVYVTDSNNGRLLVYDKDAKLQATVGRGSGAGNLGLPRGIALDDQGRVFVLDTSGQAGFVYRQWQAGQTRLEYVGTFGTQGVANGQFMYPTGLAIDGHGKLYVADTSNNRVQLWNY